MQDSLKVGRGVPIGNVGSHVVDERQVVFDIFCGPITPEHIEQPLITTCRTVAIKLMEQ